ncbi:MAG: hypothetical protein HZC01_05480 [Candidatus Kerfeldbacteria bacterium]|nr:hypothetical protein [Candidatus Kerfeldbacteria bacterium]
MRANLKKIIIVTIAASLTILVVSLFFVNNDVAGSFDSLYHLTIVKKISTEETFIHDTYFWGNIRSVYPPLLYSFSAVIQKMTGVTDYVVLANIVSFIILLLLCSVSFLIGKQLFTSNILGFIVVLFSVLTYYVGRRFSLFLPENLSIVLFTSYVYVEFISDFRTWLRIVLGGIILGCVLLTNVLTSSMALSVIVLIIPVLIWQKKYSHLITIAGALIIASIISYYNTVIINGDLFWLNYVKIPFALSFCLSIFVLICDILNKRFGIHRLQTLIAFIIGISVLLFLFHSYIFHVVTTEQYWRYDQFTQKVDQNLSRYFLDNGASRLGVNPIIALLGVISILGMIFTKKLLDARFLPFTLTISLSVFIVMIGPYFGIEPSSNSPRAMLYISVLGPVIAVFGIYQMQHYRLFRSVIPLLVCAIFITSIPNIIGFSGNVITKPPVGLVNYLSTHVQPEDILISHPISFYSIYVASENDLNSLMYTPIQSTDFEDSENREIIDTAGVIYLIDGAYGRYSQLVRSKELTPVFSEGDYSLFVASQL